MYRSVQVVRAQCQEFAQQKLGCSTHWTSVLTASGEAVAGQLRPRSALTFPHPPPYAVPEESEQYGMGLCKGANQEARASQGRLRPPRVGWMTEDDGLRFPRVWAL